MTTLSISLPPETAAKLRKRAAAAGKDPVSFVRDVVEEKLNTPQGFAEILAPVHQEFAAGGMNETELDTLLRSTLDAAHRDRRAKKGS